MQLSKLGTVYHQYHKPSVDCSRFVDRTARCVATTARLKRADTVKTQWTVAELATFRIVPPLSSASSYLSRGLFIS